MAVLLIVIVSSVYLIGSTLEELIIDYGEQTERTHADITNRLADLVKNNA